MPVCVYMYSGASTSQSATGEAQEQLRQHLTTNHTNKL